MKKLIFFVLLMLGLTSGYSQQQIVKGRIIGAEDGKAIDGATIRSLMAQSITESRGDGGYSITVLDTDTLLVERVGYVEKRVPIRTQRDTTLNIVLSHNNSVLLSDVIVNTGYQHIAKERATGSFQQINEELLNRATGPNIIDRLKGVANSVYFDPNTGHPPVTIRGLGTLTTSQSAGTSSPLIILDNFPYEGDINNINPNDIESITILRDAAAASIWGAKAGNGVIVINSKTPGYRQPFRLSVNANTTLTEKPDLFYVSGMSSSEFIDVEKFLFEKGWYDGDLQNTEEWPIISPVVSLLDAQRNGTITEAEAQARINEMRNLDVRKDYLKYFYRTGVQQQYSVSLSGGRENISFFTSLGYDKNQKNLIRNDDDRITWNNMVTIEPVKKLTLRLKSISSWAALSTNNPLPVRLSRGKEIYPYAQLGSNADPAVLAKDYRTAFKDTAGNNRLLDWQYRPLDELKYADNSSQRTSQLVDFSIKYNLSSHLTTSVKYQHQQEENESRNYYSDKTYYTRNLVNLFSMPDGDNIARAIPDGGILDQSGYTIISNAARGQVDFDRTYRLKHAISAIAGGEIRETKTSGSNNRTYGYNDNNLTSANVNYNLSHPILNNLPFTSFIPNTAGFTGLLNRMVSIFGNASYTYDSRYILSASARKDASNILGVSTNNKWNPLWSTGAAWNVSNEAFYNLEWLPYLKGRITYGYSGNVNNTISALTTLNYTSLNTSGISTLPYALVASPPNASLRWEKIGMLNLGLDFGLKNGAVNGSIEYYIKRSTDVIAGVPADITLAGEPSLIKNSANLTGRGIDVMLNTVNINKALRWQSAFIYSYNKVVVSKYLLPSVAAASVGDGDVIVPITGENPYNIISYKWGGLNPENGNPTGFLNDQKTEDYAAIITQAGWDDLVISGPAIPAHFGAVRNSVSYRNLELSFNIAFKFGYFIRKSTINYTNLFGYWVSHGDFKDRWQKPGDERHTDVPSMVYPANYHRDLFYQNSEATVIKGDHIRLQDVSLSYTLPGKSKPKINLYAYASNLGIIWRANKEGIDPDANNNLPIPRRLSFGCRIDL